MRGCVLTPSRVLRATDGLAPGQLDDIVRHLSSGGLLVYPTDTLYGLGGPALDAGSARRTRAMKGRPDGKPFPLVAADVQAVRSLALAWTPLAEALAKAFWPGPLSLVIAAADVVPHEVTGESRSVAIRVPGAALTRAICAATGPLIATSANRSSAPAPLTCSEALESLGWPAEILAVDAGPGRPQPSTLVDVSGDQPRLVRVGAVTWQQITAALGIDYPP